MLDVPLRGFHLEDTNLSILQVQHLFPDPGLLSVSSWKAVDSLKDKDCSSGALWLQTLFSMRPWLFSSWSCGVFCFF